MRTVVSNEDGPGPVKIAFKPAGRSKATDSFCKSSDKAVNSKAAFWISMAAPIAVANAVVYGCAVQLKILAYIVIVPVFARNKYAGTCSGYAEVDRPENGLPLAEVTVC